MRTFLFMVIMMLIFFGYFLGYGSTVNQITNDICSGKYDRVISNESIISMVDSSSIHGSFLLGTGSIDERGYYISYAGNDTMGYRRQLYPINSRIFQDTEIHPFVLTRTKHMCTGDGFWIQKFMSSVTVIQTEFHVPNGTIIREFSIGDK